MKKFIFRKVYVFFSPLFIFLVHLPFVFAKSKPMELSGKKMSAVASGSNMKLLFPIEGAGGNNIYDSLRLNIIGLSYQAFEYAMKGFHYLADAGKLANDHILSIIDFSKPSSEKRLFIIDIHTFKLLFNTYVAHGSNSGREYARQFSNTPESNKSSLGFYETSSTYIGKNGYSLKLEGLDRGFNDNALTRDIVMHGADYVNEELARSQGYIGRSWGCPAIPLSLHKRIIDKIKGGSCMFIYSPNPNYLSHSRILNR